MRFQIRYRFPRRSVSKSSIVTLSTPGAPLLAFTCRYASQTSHLEISNDFPADFSLSMQLLPASSRLTHEQRHRCPGPFAPPPPRPAGTSALLRTGPPAHPRSVLNPLRVHPRLGHSLSPPPTIRQGQYQDMPSHVPCESSRSDSRRLHAGQSGGRGESHPPAPTEPCVTVSRHPALPIMSA